MNRGIMVTRDDPGIDELVLSARLFPITLCFYCYYLCNVFVYRGICSSDGNSEVCKRLDCFFAPLAEAYNEICQEQAEDENEQKQIEDKKEQEQAEDKKEFFGLRDFYRYK